jgi:hypothetical protein
MLHLSEVSSFPSHSEAGLLSGLLPTVPDNADSEIFFESTGKPASGLGGAAFFKQYKQAKYRAFVRMGDNGEAIVEYKENSKAAASNVYTTIFLPWFIHKPYRIEVSSLENITEDEQKLVKLYNLSIQQLAWRRYAIENKCGNDVMAFRREYPSCEEDAWASVANSIFNLDKLDAIKTFPPIGCIGWDGQKLFLDENGILSIWKGPEEGGQYIVGSDIASGVGEDFSTVQVIDHITGEQVAEARCRLGPEQHGVFLEAIGLKYNCALIAPERNGLGISTVQKLEALEYPNLYRQRSVTPAEQYSEQQVYGWLTSGQSKVSIVNWGASLVLEGESGVVSSELVDEMKLFVRDDKGVKMGASRGGHDDLLMAWLIAQWVRRTPPDLSPFARLPAAILPAL